MKHRGIYYSIIKEKNSISSSIKVSIILLYLAVGNAVNLRYANSLEIP